MKIQRIYRVVLALAGVFSVGAYDLTAQVEGREWAELGSVGEAERVLKFMPAETRVQSLMIPMPDGIGLATTVFLPEGDGPWPVLFARGYYGRFTMAGYARSAASNNLAFLVQDARGIGDSEGKGTFDSTSFLDEWSDIRSALDWIASQSWCDGEVLMTGGSGNGIDPTIAFFLGHPALAGVSVSSTAGIAEQWSFENGARRWLYNWMRHRGLNVQEWPRPSVGSPHNEMTHEVLNRARVRPDVPYVVSAGWYDILVEASIDYFEAFHEKAPVIVKIEPRHHFGMAEVNGVRWPRKAPIQAFPQIGSLMSREWSPSDSCIQYYLMGDVNSPDGPGNEWRVTKEWPVPHTPTAFYLQADHSIGMALSMSDQSLSYIYDPEQPAPTRGGRVTYFRNMGPRDQRSLKEREDCLRFTTSSSLSPLTITGLISAQLSFQTDVPDTMFIVKVVDIYPDGYEALIVESAGLARFADGLDGETSLKPNHVYDLKIKLGNTAWLLDVGHRLGVYVTSSAASENDSGKYIEAYEVHPNQFDPVESPSNFKVGHHRILLGGEHASFITLPILTE